MVNALMVRDLTHRHPGCGTPALDDLGPSLSENRLAFVLDPNGSGKSTLFRVPLRPSHTDPGEAEIGGRQLESYGPAALAGAVSYIPQPSEVPFNFSGRHTVVLGQVTYRGLRVSPRRVNQRAADEILEAIGMMGLGECGIQELSGGERQLVLIACILCQGGWLLVLNEPASALDAGNQIWVLRRFRRPVDRQDLTMLLSSHQPNYVFEFVDDVLFPKQGHSLGLKPVADLTGEDLNHLYDLPMRVVDLTDMPELCLRVTRSETRGDQ